MNETELTATQPETGLLPWHSDQWQGVMARLGADTLPHALLMTGLRGLGKNRFASTLAQALLCGQPDTDGQACHVCRSCLLYKADNHPDYFRVHPKEDDKPKVEDSSVEKTKLKEKSKLIVVDQIRELNAHLALKSQYAGRKLVIISPAEQMNLAAANSLLKTLEEPAEHSLLLLITSQPALLLATVRSRCQRINFTPPSETLAASWLATRLEGRQNPLHLLALAGGAPLTALNMATSEALARRAGMLDDLEKLLKKQADPVMLAAAWLKGNVAEILVWMLSCIMDMARLSSAAQPPYLANPDLRQHLSLLAERLSLPLIYAHLDSVTEAIRLLNRQINTQLLLEDMLISWVNVTRINDVKTRF